MRQGIGAAVVLGTMIAGCSAPPPPAAPMVVADPAADKKQINAALDDWHDAAARADEARYFGHLAPEAIFLGTDAKERWDVAAFRRFAHPFFAKGKAWDFHSVRRDVTIDRGGAIAWFDEDLATKNLGPARGSGVLVKTAGQWLIVHYNLAITVPNERFDDVKAVLGGSPPK